MNTSPFAPHQISAIFEAAHGRSDRTAHGDGTRSGRKSRRLTTRAFGFFARR